MIVVYGDSKFALSKLSSGVHFHPSQSLVSRCTIGVIISV